MLHSTTSFLSDNAEHCQIERKGLGRCIVWQGVSCFRRHYWRKRERGGGQVGCCQSLFFLQVTTPLYLLSQNRNKTNHATDVTSKQEMSPEHACFFLFLLWCKISVSQQEMLRTSPTTNDMLQKPTNHWQWHPGRRVCVSNAFWYISLMDNNKIP